MTWFLFGAVGWYCAMQIWKVHKRYRSTRKLMDEISNIAEKKATSKIDEDAFVHGIAELSVASVEENAIAIVDWGFLLALLVVAMCVGWMFGMT